MAPSKVTRGRTGAASAARQKAAGRAAATAAARARLAAAARAGMSGAMIGAIRAYQLCLSPWLGRGCRYLPTCSVYAIDAVRRFGPARGGWLAAKRIARCHPWGGSGYDPIPEAAAPHGGHSARDGDSRSPTREL